MVPCAEPFTQNDDGVKPARAALATSSVNFNRLQRCAVVGLQRSSMTTGG
jgi:hypothetical protein